MGSLGFYYSLIQARITDALERNPEDARKKYTYLKVLWFVFLGIAYLLDSNSFFILLILVWFATIPLAYSLRRINTWNGFEREISDSPELEWERRRRILKRIDKKESGDNSTPTND